MLLRELQVTAGQRRDEEAALLSGGTAEEFRLKSGVAVEPRW